MASIPPGKPVDLLIFRYEAAQKADDLERGLGDILDVKASILLVAVVFLVDISKRLMESQPEVWAHPTLHAVIQILSVFLLAASAVLIMLEWWPRRYALPPDPEEEDAWVLKLQTQASKEEQSDGSVTEAILNQKLRKTLQRCRENQKINSVKSAFLKWAFWATAPVILFDLGTLVLLAVGKLCPLLN